MQLDDTRDKVYIHNLDEELKAVDAEEEGKRAIFLPDIERKLNRIPKSVLTGHAQPLKNKEMVLYSIPSSLTVPKEQDNVRRAIIESRARTRQKQAYKADVARSSPNPMQVAANNVCGEQQHAEGVTTEAYAGDEDAMDLG